MELNSNVIPRTNNSDRRQFLVWTASATLSATLFQATRRTANATSNADRIVVLTFDDAVKSQRTIVAPLLKELGFGATFFVCHQWMVADPDHYLTWQEIAEIHHLHVWGLSTTECACTAHLVKHEPNLDDKLLQRIAAQLHDRFGIEHSTIQFESSRGPACPTEPAAESVGLAKR